MLRVRIVSIIVAVLIIAAVVVQVVRPLPAVTMNQTVSKTSTISGQLHFSYPSQGQSAVATENLGVISTSGSETPVPIASLTKMMTTYVVLKHHPLGAYSSGPTYTMTQNDVKEYQKDLAAGDSVVKVVAGSKWTELQMLEGLLLPSGDNMANTLAQWTSGSVQNFVQEMNQAAKQLGMTHTTYTDASGVSPSTVSTAADQLKVATAIMKIQAVRNIVDLPQAQLPGAGVVYNVDYSVGKNGIVGVKTGSTLQAGGCFTGAMYGQVNGHKVLMLSTVLGQQGVQPLSEAISANVQVLRQVSKQLHQNTLSQGTTVATINVPWQGQIPLTTSKSITYYTYPGLQVSEVVRSTPSGGYDLTLDAGTQHFSVPLKQAQTVKKASIVWRLTRGLTHTKVK